MKRLALLPTILLVPFLFTACEDGPLEEAGETIDDAADETGDAIEDAADDVKDAVDGD